METLYHQTNKLILETQQWFQRLEGSRNQEEVEVEIERKINEINSNCQRLDVLVFKVPATQRSNAKMQCDQLKYDSRHLDAALSAWREKRASRLRAAHEREQLLNRKFAPNQEATAINIDYSLQHNNALSGASNRVEEMLQTGAGTLESLRLQRNTLKGAQKRILDMANTLGLSDHTMRLIVRRAREDKYVLMGGMAVTVLVIVLVVVYYL